MSKVVEVMDPDQELFCGMQRVIAQGSGDPTYTPQKHFIQVHSPCCSHKQHQSPSAAELCLSCVDVLVCDSLQQAITSDIAQITGDHSNSLQLACGGWILIAHVQG